MAHVLPRLNYDYGALEPHMDAQTVEIHLTKHHQTYITNLNKALVDDEERVALSIADLQQSAGYAGPAIRNNAGGHYNHLLYWQNMAPIGTSSDLPHGPLAAKIEESFGSFDQFKEQFSSAAVSRFASGWAFLTVKADGNLAVHNTPGHDNPLMQTVSDIQGIPILTCDVWEHAYYLRYQNRRAEFVANWWKIVNWDAIAANYNEFALRGLPVPF